MTIYQLYKRIRIAAVWALMLALMTQVFACAHAQTIATGDKMMMFADTSRGRSFAKDPAVVRFKGQYFLYYSMCPKPNQTEWAIGIATSKDLIHWDKVGELLPGDGFESKGICAPGAKVINGKVHMFYQTYGNAKRDAICHAVSDDGVTFERNKTNPIFAPTGDWTCGRAIDADVVPFKDQLFLYFATRDPDFKIQKVGVASAPLDSDYSKAKWTQRSNDSILQPELKWEGKCIEASATCVHEGKIYMFYAGNYNNQPQQIGCAVSEDGITFKRLFDQPFLPAGKQGAWNSSESGHPFLFTDDDGRMYLFYQGNNDNGKSWYLTNVEITWKNGLPQLPAGYVK